MRKRLLLLTLLSLAACSGENITGLDQAVYNATYSGAASFSLPFYTPALSVSPPTPPSADLSTPPAPTFRISMTLSQLGQNITGTFLVADSTGTRVYSGSVTGKTTNTGADFTFVVPAPCPGALYGSFTVSNGELSGAANGRDCASGGRTGSNVYITFTNLVRQ
ncbi:MAG: hypothetical protein ABI311_12900 [Gemmatimonadaceae bacterium]